MITPYHTSFVLDASVAFKWFTTRKEPDRDAALTLRERHISGKCRLIVPEFFFLEVLNVIRYHPQANEGDAANALMLLENLHLRVESVTWDLLRKTNAISWSYGAAVYDAAYVALAERVGFPLVTADHALVKRMRGHSIVIRLKDLGLK